MFLIDICFKRRLYHNTPKAIERTFKFIQNALENLKVDKIDLETDRINFKNSVFNGHSNSHIMATIGKGYFAYKQSTSVLIYSISTLRTFIFSCGAFCMLTLVSSSILTGVLSFLWLYGMNWLISATRHKRFFNKLMNEVEEKSSDTKHNHFLPL